MAMSGDNVWRGWGVLLCALMWCAGCAGVPALDDKASPSLVVSKKWALTNKHSLYPHFNHLLGRNNIHALLSLSVRNNQIFEPQDVTVTLEMPYAKRLVQKVRVEEKQTHVLSLTPQLDHDALYALRSAQWTEAHVSIQSSNGTRIDFSKRIKLEPLRDAPWQLDVDATQHDVRAWMMVLVTPDDTQGMVRALVEEADPNMPGGRAEGYNLGNAYELEAQIRILYDTLKARSYTSRPVPASYFQGVRSLQMPSEALKRNSGDSMETALVMASALEHIGVDVRLVFTSTGVFLAVAHQPGGEGIAPLDVSNIQGASYEQARAVAAKHITQAQADDPGYLVVPLWKARKGGMEPVLF